MLWDIIYQEGLVKIIEVNESFKDKSIQRNKRVLENVHVQREEGGGGASRRVR